MGRERRQTVDFFPHYVKSGRTVSILESRYGNDGYAFWFKLLEILGGADGHFIDCSNPTEWEYLLAKTRVEDEDAERIIATLISIGKIDGPLWEQHRILWVQRLVDNVTKVYSKRASETPQKPCFGNGKHDNEVISGAETQYSIEEKRREEESREDGLNASKVVDLWNTICGKAGLPKVEKLTESRRKKIKIRLAEFGSSESEQAGTLKDILNAIVASNFLMGENKTHWTATFDWLVTNSENWTKVLEGNYDNERKRAPVAPQPQVRLGVGEYIDNEGNRRYSPTLPPVPMDAPPRQSKDLVWSRETNTWIPPLC